MKRPSVMITALMVLVLAIPGCAQTSLNCKQPKVFCVGLVTDVGRRDDRAYNQAAWEGIQQAKNNATADWIASIETVDARDYGENIKVFADAGYDVIVTVGSALGDATRAAAAAYPDTYFIGVDQDQTGSQVFNPNLTGLIFPEDEIGYLAGALAALMSQTGQIGAICGSDQLISMRRYGEGFLAGAALINPKVKVAVAYHDQVSIDKSLKDPEWGAATANSLIDAGADIIFGVGGTTGSNAIVAAAMRGAYGIGADTDEYYALPVAAPRLYASALKLIASDVTTLIKMAADAQAKTAGFPTGNYQGQIGLSPYHDLSSAVPEGVKTRLSKLNQDLLTGAVRTGVVITNP